MANRFYPAEGIELYSELRVLCWHVTSLSSCLVALRIVTTSGTLVSSLCHSFSYSAFCTEWSTRITMFQRRLGIFFNYASSFATCRGILHVGLSMDCLWPENSLSVAMANAAAKKAAGGKWLLGRNDWNWTCFVFAVAYTSIDCQSRMLTDSEHGCSTSLCRPNVRSSLSRGQCHVSTDQSYQVLVVDVYDLVLHGYPTPSGFELVLLHQHFGIGSLQHGTTKLKGSCGRCMAWCHCRGVACSSRNVTVESQGILCTIHSSFVGSLQAVWHIKGRCHT